MINPSGLDPISLFEENGKSKKSEQKSFFNKQTETKKTKDDIINSLEKFGKDLSDLLESAKRHIASGEVVLASHIITEVQKKLAPKK